MFAELRGTNFRPVECQMQARELIEGSYVELRRDPGNKHDANAIGVWSKDLMIGYVAKEIAAKIASDMDHGKNFKAVVEVAGKPVVLKIEEIEPF